MHPFLSCKIIDWNLDRDKFCETLGFAFNVTLQGLEMAEIIPW